MSRFEQVAQEVAQNSYLREWYDNVQKALDDYRPAIPTEDDIIGTVAFQMLKRCEDMRIPTEDDRSFFTKILWVILERTKGNYEFLPCAEKKLNQKLHAKQVSLLIERAKG